MYRAYWGMEFNPFDKEISEKQFYHGTGKTVCQRAFVNDLNPNLYKVIYLPMTTISTSEFYRDLASGLGLDRMKQCGVVLLRRYSTQRHWKQLTAVAAEVSGG